MSNRVTRKNLPLVWLRLTAYVAEVLEHDAVADDFCAVMDAWLDGMADDDAFGTEGQNDPRGDQRK